MYEFIDNGFILSLTQFLTLYYYYILITVFLNTIKKKTNSNKLGALYFKPRYT